MRNFVVLTFAFALIITAGVVAARSTGRRAEPPTAPVTVPDQIASGPTVRPGSRMRRSRRPSPVAMAGIHWPTGGCRWSRA